MNYNEYVLFCQPLIFIFCKQSFGKVFWIKYLKVFNLFSHPNIFYGYVHTLTNAYNGTAFSCPI